MPQRGEHRPARPDAQGARTLGLARAAGRRVEGVGDGATRLGDLRKHEVGVAVAEQRGDSVVLLTHELLPARAGREVEAVADVEQPLVGRIERAARPVGEPRRGEGADHGEVAQSAAPLLEVGLGQVGELAVAVVALTDRLEELGQATARIGPPVVRQGRADPGHEVGVAGDEPHVEQANCRDEIGACDVTTVRERAHAVVEPDPRVPQRIPDLLGDPLDRGRAVATVVEEDEVEVRAGPAVPPREAPDRGQRDALPGRGAGRPGRCEPLPRHRGDRVTPPGPGTLLGEGAQLGGLGAGPGQAADIGGAAGRTRDRHRWSPFAKQVAGPDGLLKGSGQAFGSVCR